MKIIETDEPILKIYDDGEQVWLEFEDRAHSFSPLEAQALCQCLLKVVNNTSYFRGLAGART
jgi:hypothetical protein